MHLTVEHRISPIGIDATSPRFSWWLGDARPNATQTASEIVIETLAPDGRTPAERWTTGKIATAASVDVVPAGFTPQPATRYRWQVRTWDAQDKPSEWSVPAYYETGLMDNAAWNDSAWITHPARDHLHPESVPAACMRTTFATGKPIARARLYATARGLFEPWLNGKRVGDDYFVPGWTDYAKTNQYLTYDVTPLLQKGDNCLGAIVGDGWYAGRLMWRKQKNFYGQEPALRMRLEILHSDGTRTVVATGENWRVSEGPIRTSDIYDGENYDARLDPGPWNTAAYDDAKWKPATVVTDGKTGDRLVGKIVQPVRVTQTLAAKSVTKSGEGAWIFDFGQNMVGIPRMKLSGRAGQTVTLRYAEMLQDNGQLYTENYRSAKSTDTYTFARDGVVEWSPTFTFHGFRYIEISGVSEKPTPDALKGLVLHNEMEPTGEFTTSSALVNRLQDNITWGQRGNFLEVPTDCPQRDERLGWTGDAQIFARTSAFNYDVRAFFEKWMGDLRDAQFDDGGVPNFIPSLGQKGTAAAWGDAVTIVPWAVYQLCGDKRILEQNYDAMKRWIAYLKNSAPEGIRPEQGYGDWLALDKENPKRNDDTNTPKSLVGTAFYAWSTELTARTADVLGHADEAKALREQRDYVRDAFQKKFIAADGTVAGKTQTGCLLALAFDLAPETQREKILTDLVADIEARGWHLSTGFVGTGILMPTLSACGRNDVAFKLLMQETYPGWLYSIHQGATTMWERWNSYTKDKGFGLASMNSFNHYAYGAVGEWMYATIGGLNAVEPGYKKILIKPVIGGGLTHARCTLKTPYGTLSSDWKLTGDTFELKTVVPPNTTATIELPDGTREESGSGARTWRVKLK
jgi:alpha-L-rhamnosidase